MQDPRSDGGKSRFGLGSALGISLLVHLLLVAVYAWLPVARAEVRSEPKDSVLKFTFAQPSPDAPVDVRTPGPPIPAPDVRPVPRPAPPVETRRESRPQPPAAQSSPETRSENRSYDPAETSGAPPPEAVEAPQPEPRRLDLGRAMRDFGETLDRAQRVAKPGRGTSEFTPDPAQFPTTGYGMGNLSFETRDFDWSDYARQIYIAIWRAWHNRLYQTVDEFEKWAYANGWFLNHANRIRFVIERSGQVTGIVVEGESGCEPLDASATQALAEVILPPLPSDFPKDREVVHARFLAEGSIQEMRPSLTRLKRYGLF